MPGGPPISQPFPFSGPPPSTGSATYHITVTDSQGNTSTIQCSVNVQPPLMLTCAAIANAVQGVAITPVQLVATGGTGGYKFSSNDMPGGLTLTQAGANSWAP